MMKIGIFGSASANKKESKIAKQLGIALRPFDVIIVTGACSGIPYEVAKHSEKEIWGFSPVRSQRAQKAFTPNDDLSIYKKLIFIPKNFPYLDLDVCKKYRNVISTAECDAGIIVSGKWGTLNEFTNLIDFHKPVGILLGSGGIADQTATFYKKIDREKAHLVVCHSSPEKLIEKLLEKIKKIR